MTPRTRAFALCLTLSLGGCERGCARATLESHDPRQLGRALAVSQGTDCPDGLARCQAGSVSVSRLATVPASCAGPASACTCPWDVVGECPSGCVIEGMELVVDAPLATAQLCAPPSRSGPPPASAWTGGALPATTCDDGDAYRCSGGSVVDCAGGTPVGRCVRGCYREGASAPDGPVRPTREQAFALLCSR